MRIGVVSDTHNNLKSVRQIVEIFNSEEVDRVVHTGDITKGSTLALFSDLQAPLFGVFGNNDVERQGLDEVISECGFTYAEHYLDLDWESRRVVVVHDPFDLNHIQADYNLVLHGHTHMYRADKPDQNKLIFNPGECAGHMKGLNAVGIVDLDDLNTEILKF